MGIYNNKYKSGSKHICITNKDVCIRDISIRNRHMSNSIRHTGIRVRNMFNSDKLIYVHLN